MIDWLVTCHSYSLGPTVQSKRKFSIQSSAVSLCKRRHSFNSKFSRFTLQETSLCKRPHFARAVTLQETSLCKRPHFARAVTLQVTSLCKGRHFTTWRLSYSFEATKWCEKRLDPALLYVTVGGNERLNLAIWENGSSFYGFGTSYDIFFLLSFLLVKSRSVILETKYFETKKEIQADANKLFLIC